MNSKIDDFCINKMFQNLLVDCKTVFIFFLRPFLTKLDLSKLKFFREIDWFKKNDAILLRYNLWAGCPA